MKIFISWSGDQARTTAERLGEWLRSLFQSNVELFVSSKDIEKGDRWADRLAAVLQDYDFGIVVLNPANKEKPWVNFEAGALSKNVSKGRLVPVLCGLTPGDLLESPLGQFQGIEADKGGLFDLARTVNAGLDRSIETGDLNEALEVWWEKKGKPVTEFGDGKATSVKKDSQPTLRDVMARIDRTESLLTGMIHAVTEQARMDKMVWDAEKTAEIAKSVNMATGAGKSGVLGTYFKSAPTVENTNYDEILKVIEALEAQKKGKS